VGRGVGREEEERSGEEAETEEGLRPRRRRGQRGRGDEEEAGIVLAWYRTLWRGKGCSSKGDPVGRMGQT